MTTRNEKVSKVGKSSELVAGNITMYRKRAGHTMRSLADEMAANGRKISHTAISQIENLQRRVDIDELVIIAAYLDTSVVALLTPHNDDPSEEIGSAFSEHDTAKMVVHRTYGEGPYFPEWVKDEIDRANGSSFENPFMSAHAIKKMTDLFKDDEFLAEIVDRATKQIKEDLKDGDNGVD
jgi:transcriptional regulator with XRE-family HTH domain